MEVLERENRKGHINYLKKKKKAENSPNWKREHIQVQETKKVINKINLKRSTPRHRI